MSPAIGGTYLIEMIINWFLIVSLLGGFIFLVLWLVNKLTTSGDSTNKQTPSGILKERYAKGELTKEQFAQIKKDLD